MGTRDILAQLISASTSRTVSGSASLRAVTRVIAWDTTPRWSSIRWGKGASHTSAHTLLSWRNAAEWNVAAVTPAAEPCPWPEVVFPTPSWFNRARISAAAFTENVTASTRSGFHAPVAHA